MNLNARKIRKFLAVPFKVLGLISLVLAGLCFVITNLIVGEEDVMILKAQKSGAVGSGLGFAQKREKQNK